MGKFNALAAVGAAAVSFAVPAKAQDAIAVPAGNCELHVWPTSNYGGVYFHAANGRLTGFGVEFDLVDTPVPTAAKKTYIEFDNNQQNKVLIDSIQASGRFAAYKIIAHDPLPPEKATKYANLVDEPVGAGSREISSSSPCYAEMHVTYITVFRTNLSKMLMTGFLVRYFSAVPTENAERVIHSRPKRGEERIGLSNFDFSTMTPSQQESNALANAFKFMVDRFLKKKVTP